MEVRQFTSFAGYYRRFVKDFSKIAKPLTDLHSSTSNKKVKKVIDVNHSSGVMKNKMHLMR